MGSLDVIGFCAAASQSIESRQRYRVGGIHSIDGWRPPFTCWGVGGS